MRDKVVKFEKKLTYILQILGGVFVVVGTFLIFYSAMARYLVGHSPVWTEEGCRMLVLACAFWLMGHMEFSNGQVCLSIITDSIKNEKVLKVLYLIKYCVVVVVAILCTYWGSLQFVASKGQRTFTQIYPKQLPAATIPIGMVILILYCIMKIYLMLTEKKGPAAVDQNDEIAETKGTDN
ncbi:TRAP transporter small permease [uncultured Eubacterium sp.]|uniref:TRAP transporter small permease n=1 Tax=uncultured Eubacterium sp. TaxID=165185 RepID=UPI0015B2B903|nr:TRAP transporter small permease [uncultured Eubacterium sp.]